MPAPPLTLDAALRDLASPDPAARGQAAQHLAAALLAELGDPPPRLNLAAAHPSGQAARAALTRALDDPAVPVRALAAAGLGQLGDPDVLPRVAPWLADPSSQPDAGHLRECAAIVCVLLGLAARPGSDDLSRTTYQDCLARISAALSAAAPDLRFQAAGGLVELAGAAAEPALLAALAAEAHPKVRHALVAALAELDPPGPDACVRLAAIAEDPASAADLAYPAALGLAAARDPRGGPRLVDALRRPDDRARALEALAVLGPAAPPAARRAALKLARGWFTPGVMRVRAAYALTRMSPETGAPLLDELARRANPAVQEAIADARAALAALAAREAC